MKYLVLVLALTCSSCASNPPDTSQLSPEGLRQLKLVQTVRAVNDVTTAAIAANKAGQLSDAATAGVLTVNKQVLDTIEANPSNYQQFAVTAVRNARDALPADVNALIDAYLQKTLAAIGAIQ